MPSQLGAVAAGRNGRFIARLLLINLINTQKLVLPCGVVRRGFRTSTTLSELSVKGPPKINYGKTFEKILVANRGEIAVRVIKTARKMGIKTVAVHSDADANSLFVQLADEAVQIGPAPTNQSYLKVENIMKAIKQTGAQAVHPGYGFLSENSQFVKALDAAGVAFIGPSESAMAKMGDKIQSKIIAKEAGVNTIPGFNGVVKDLNHAKQIANEVGYPIMIKASAGGGGKGMRVAWNDKELAEGYKITKSESMSSFGDDRLLIEKFIDNPRHIEIQLIADKHGNTIYLPERECSIQRRNQKVIEEAPSTHLDERTRKAMGEQAVALAKNVGYSSAGTCEFLVDSQLNFYFLEMNTRLQVEHPITEYITKLDLVEQMIRVAAGQKLAFSQNDISIDGWAIESRVYAEDPEKYLPSIGRLSKYIEPKGHPGKENGVRCDSGIVEGSEISIYYDPMICKLCTHGRTRKEAIATMTQALDEYVIKGVTHNIPLLREVVNHKRFLSGDISTKFLAEEYPEGFRGHSLNEESLNDLVSISAIIYARRALRDKAWEAGGGDLKHTKDFRSSWKLFVCVKSGGVDHVKSVIAKRSESELGGLDEFTVSIDGQPGKKVDADWPLETAIVRATIEDVGAVDPRKITVQYLDRLPMGFRLQHLGTKFDMAIRTPRQQELMKHMKEKPKQDMNKYVLAPMPGTIVSVAVKAGDEIGEEAEVAVVESMKMANVIKSSRVGRVKSVNVQAGSSVAAEEILIEFEDAPKGAAGKVEKK